MITSVSDAGPRTSRIQSRLAGPSRRLDLRVNAVRADLADAALAGIVTAARYAEGVTRVCTVAAAMVRSHPDDGATAVSALLFGESFTVFDVAGGWAWGQCQHDRYVGWIGASALEPPAGTVTHRIVAPTAAVFAAPDIKAPATGSLPLNARLVAGEDAGMFVAAAGGFVHRRYVRAVGDVGGDPVAIGLGFVGSPYVWGARTRDGIDCSGLTQAVLGAVGIAAPRDSDQQRDAFAAVAADDRRRGDLAVFPGHVGLLVDRDTLLHANAHWMTTVVEPLADVAARLAPTGFRRPPYD